MNLQEWVYLITFNLESQTNQDRQFLNNNNILHKKTLESNFTRLNSNSFIMSHNLP